MKPSSIKPGRIALVVLAVALVALVAACGATSKLDSAPAPATAGKALAGGPAVAPERTYDADNLGLTDTTRAAGTGTGTDKSEAVQTKAVISKGQISLTTKDIDKARFDLQKLLDTYGGSIANEKSDADEHGNTDRDRLELRVPSARFDEAMEAIGKLGTLVDRSRTSEDVTTQLIDVAARVRTQRLSLARVQALLARADTINEVIAIEAQLSQRQADLDSLEQQQKYLADQTSLSTITLYLTTPDKSAAPVKKDKHAFVTGLSAGWDQLGRSTSAVLTGIGAVLPFGILLALIGVPAWVLISRRTLRARDRSAA